MSSELHYAKGINILDLSTLLKVFLAIEIYEPSIQTKQDEEGLKLINSKSGFSLKEPNTIVRYLANDFTDKKVIGYEESVLHKALMTDNVDKVAEALDDVPSWGQGGQRLLSEEIILFASAYPALSRGKKSPARVSDWFIKVSKNPLVAKGIKRVLDLVKLQRIPEKNTGVQRVISGHLVKESGDPIVPKEGEKNILITSALPYVNNVPHLGNIVGSVLSADVYARYAKNRNYNALFIGGTDEYGTATETKALAENITPQELCDKYHVLHRHVYDWFDIKFDYFGRTTTELQTDIAQDIFTKLYKNEFLDEKTVDQLYCEVHDAFLADRFVEGTCPKCQYDDARGDQCDKCGTLLDPFELINPRCKLDGSSPVKKASTHMYLQLDKLEPDLKEWIEEASRRGFWSKNSKNITNAWLKQGLEPKCITRDLKWGTPVPLADYDKKVLYVWFDATIGYVSITANYFKEKKSEGWKEWWLNPEMVDLYQFMGKDNVPFHTVVFPASQIGTRDTWTKLYHVNTTEYLQYEGGKFSKSRGIGVFGNNAQEIGISPSVWRYYLLSIRPETQDTQFSWNDFVTRNNSELLANLGNFVNRIVKFAIAKYNGVIPEFDTNKIIDYNKFKAEVDDLLKTYVDSMDAALLRKGLEIAMGISSRGNQFLQGNKLDNDLYNNHEETSDAVVGVALNLVYLVSAVISPFMPETRDQICHILNAPNLSITDKFELVLQPGHNIGKAQYLFKRIDEKKIDEWRNLYGGNQEQ